MHWILSPEPQSDQMTVCPIPLVEELLMNEHFVSMNITWLRQNMIVRPDLIPVVAGLTCGQRTNPMWSAIRKFRFTASNFGQILRAINRKRFDNQKSRIVCVVKFCNCNYLFDVLVQLHLWYLCSTACAIL